MEPFMELDEQFKHNPTINPKTGKEVEIGTSSYKKLVHKYGEPYKVKSPKSDKLISIGKGEYNKLVKEGYTFEKLKHAYKKELVEDTYIIDGNMYTKSELAKIIHFYNENTQKEIKSEDGPTYDVPLTGIRDTDLKILRNLSSYELANLCTTNKYINNLCNNDPLIKAMIEPILYYVYHPIVPNVIPMYNIKVKYLADINNYSFEEFCNIITQERMCYYKNVLPVNDDQVVYANKGLEIDLSVLHQNTSVKLPYFDVLTYCQIVYLIAKKLTAPDPFIYFALFIEQLQLEKGVYKLKLFTTDPMTNRKVYIK